MTRFLRLTALLFTALASLGGCSTTPPAGITAVTPFDIQRYQGRWYEIARRDHSFERGLTDVTANYRIVGDGSVEVINRGYDPERNSWREALGRALFIGEPTRGSLKVSFFGPFYAAYHVIALDQINYRWAMVVGPSRQYVWILARDKQISAEVRAQLLEQARALDIDTRQLIWVSQSRSDH